MTLRIDFISDVACPWCAVGLASFERALESLEGAVPVDLHFQPFELNPTMAPAGADATAYLKGKYGMSDAQLAQARATLRERGAAVGFEFGTRERVWNTFDAHRLLHWAGLLPGDVQWRLKRALLTAYHRDGRNPGDPEVLLSEAVALGLDPDDVRRVIEENRFADEVRAAEAEWQEAGIRAVPSVVVNGRHLIQGAQPPEAFAQALRQIAAEDA